MILSHRPVILILVAAAALILWVPALSSSPQSGIAGAAPGMLA